MPEGDYCGALPISNLRHFRTSAAGVLIKADGEFASFTVGEMLNRDTAVIHIEKAKNSVNGLYAVTNQQFAQHEWNGTTYINREQDLGLAGLRKAKESYHPLMLIDKFTVYPA